ncbi:MAG: hypothetical protein JSV22_03875 [Bacteroidales bacterium]|nr:MAG: hypothetical protein JSV22_03875 [Bacteroidales bacterium]
MKKCRNLWLTMLLCTSVGVGYAQKDFKLYGYASLYFEKVGTMSNASSEVKGDPGEFDYAHLNVMMQSNISDKIKTYFNLSGVSRLEARNYWGEYAFNDKLKIRVGKMYRRFGQFNELLDAIPTYLGMEPPELFDGDHLMLPRTGKIMLHGGTAIGKNFLNYSYMLDSDENMRISNGDEATLSHTWDLNMSLLNDNLVVGHSGYVANEANGSSVALGEGSPNAGILPWMNSDKYNVLGGYLTAKFNNITLKGAYWVAHHKAVRDTGAIVTLVQNTTLNNAQIENFFGPNYSGSYTGADVITNADYVVSAFYVRLGYSIPKEKVPLKFAEITPYVFIDGYSNPETIASKTWGGDNEAGVADDGKFYKPTIGIAIRPSHNMALKIDGSSHIQKINGETVNYKEIRIDLSFMF